MDKSVLAAKIRRAFNKSESMRDINIGDVVSSENGELGYYQGISNYSNPERIRAKLVPVELPYNGLIKATIRPYFGYKKRQIPVFIEFEGAERT